MTKADPYQVRKTGDVVRAMAADGWTRPEIAKALNLSRQTVKYHIDRKAK